MLTRKLFRDHLRRIQEQNLGFVVIVEDRIEKGDTLVTWRKEQLTQHGLVKDKEGDEEIVIVTDDKIITLGRIEKKHGPTDLSWSARAQTANRRIQMAGNTGLSVDSTRLTAETKASPFAPRTLANLEDLNGVTITDGLCTVTRGLRGETTTVHKCDNPDEHKFQIPQTPGQIKRLLIDTYNKGGLRNRIELEESCGDCGKHLKWEYYPNDWYIEEENRTVKLLKRRRVCDSRLHRGMPGTITIGNPETIGSLGSFKNH